MSRQFNPNQTLLFPEMCRDEYLPSIETAPDFDFALQNLIRLSDFGAFTQPTFTGIDKSYSIKLTELDLNPEYLREGAADSPVFHLFPLDIRHRLERMKYHVRAFFNKSNSIRTDFGYFLFRPYFSKWYLHRQKILHDMQDYLRREVGPTQYQAYFRELFKAGVNWFEEVLSDAHPYRFAEEQYDDFLAQRDFVIRTNASIYQLDRGQADFVIQFLAVKTTHIPYELQRYIQGLEISSTYKTIHLDYLKDQKIETLEDVQALFKSLGQK